MTSVLDTNVTEMQMMILHGLLVRQFRLCFFIFLVFLASLNSSYSQTQPDYNMSLKNGALINDNVIEFDVMIKSISDSFKLTSYQCSFLFNYEAANGGELFFTYVEGSSQLTNLPTFGISINTCDGEPKLTFASMAGSDQITESEVVVGRFRLINTIAFSKVDPNITWNFGGYVTTILMGEYFQNITEPTNHTTNLTLSSKTINAELPINFELYQNYPNPFNPSTTIRIALRAESNIKLVVYNLLGEVIRELANTKIAAGTHEFTFQSDNLPSGSYIYRLEANNQIISTKKMLVLK